MYTEILYSHFNSILHYIIDNWDETDSTYHIYTLISDHFYYIDRDLWMLFKSNKFDSEFKHVDFEYNEDLDSESIKKKIIVYCIVDSIPKDNTFEKGFNVQSEEEPFIDTDDEEYEVDYE